MAVALKYGGDSRTHQLMVKVATPKNGGDPSEESFKIIQKPELIIYLLSVSRKHLIEKKFLEGNPIPKNFIKSLENLLEHYENINPEVIEWTLRTIEQLGNQSLKLRETVLKIKPSWGSLFNQHKKSSKQIIELLEKRWAPFKRR